ncbi:MAG: flippase activity-associated protein Agl23, partial [Chloroflexota bacterium]
MTTTIDQRPNRQSPDVLTRALAQVYTLNWEVITYVVIFAMAVFTRFYMLGERVMSHDESLHTRYSFNLASEGNFQHTPLMHGPVLFHMTALFYFLFGANDFTSRLYTAILGVIVVMMPILFRRWLGRWGALLAAIMLLISPITMYYNRYIRHDTPNIFFSLVMIYGMFMYLSGPEAQRRRAHWLYIIAGAMVLNLGSKETAFIYVAIIGLYLAVYWFVRLAQHFRGIDGKWPFYFIMMAFGVGGVAALGMYVTLSINLGERPFFEAFNAVAPGMSEATFITWTVLVIIGIFGLVTPTVINGFRNGRARLSVGEGLSFFFLSFLITTVLIIAEELSRIPSDEPAEGAEAIVAGVSALPVIAAWGVAGLAIGVMIVRWRRGRWDLMKKAFPEFDLLILIGTLILPWAAPFIIKLAGVHMTVQDINAYTITEIQIVVSSLVAMFAISTVAGLLWDWKKWLIANVIFYALFAFFFTTMFTNGRGVATGIVGSLGYWLEQQGVRRGNQPQYYYLGVILPMYEYLPVIGSIGAMFGGLTWFWRFRRNQLEEQMDERERALEAIVADETIAETVPETENDNILMTEAAADDELTVADDPDADFNYDYDPLPAQVTETT